MSVSQLLREKTRPGMNNILSSYPWIQKYLKYNVRPQNQDSVNLLKFLLSKFSAADFSRSRKHILRRSESKAIVDLDEFQRRIKKEHYQSSNLTDFLSKSVQHLNGETIGLSNSLVAKLIQNINSRNKLTSNERELLILLENFYKTHTSTSSSSIDQPKIYAPRSMSSLAPVDIEKLHEEEVDLGMEEEITRSLSPEEAKTALKERFKKIGEHVQELYDMSPNLTKILVDDFTFLLDSNLSQEKFIEEVKRTINSFYTVSNTSSTGKLTVGERQQLEFLEDITLKAFDNLNKYSAAFTKKKSKKQAAKKAINKQSTKNTTKKQKTNLTTKKPTKQQRITTSTSTTKQNSQIKNALQSLIQNLKGYLPDTGSDLDRIYYQGLLSKVEDKLKSLYKERKNFTPKDFLLHVGSKIENFYFSIKVHSDRLAGTNSEEFVKDVTQNLSQACLSNKHAFKQQKQTKATQAQESKAAIKNKSTNSSLSATASSNLKTDDGYFVGSDNAKAVAKEEIQNQIESMTDYLEEVYYFHEQKKHALIWGQSIVKQTLSDLNHGHLMTIDAFEGRLKERLHNLYAKYTPNTANVISFLNNTSAKVVSIAKEYQGILFWQKVKSKAHTTPQTTTRPSAKSKKAESIQGGTPSITTSSHNPKVQQQKPRKVNTVYDTKYYLKTNTNRVADNLRHYYTSHKVLDKVDLSSVTKLVNKAFLKYPSNQALFVNELANLIETNFSINLQEPTNESNLNNFRKNIYSKSGLSVIGKEKLSKLQQDLHKAMVGLFNTIYENKSELSKKKNYNDAVSHELSHELQSIKNRYPQSQELYLDALRRFTATKLKRNFNLHGHKYSEDRVNYSVAINIEKAFKQYYSNNSKFNKALKNLLNKELGINLDEKRHIFKPIFDTIYDLRPCILKPFMPSEPIISPAERIQKRSDKLIRNLEIDLYIKRLKSLLDKRSPNVSPAVNRENQLRKIITKLYFDKKKGSPADSEASFVPQLTASLASKLTHEYELSGSVQNELLNNNACIKIAESIGSRLKLMQKKTQMVA